LEIERWLTPEIRHLHAQAEKYVARVLEGKLFGTFIWEIPFDAIPNREIRREQATVVVKEIERLASSMQKGENCRISIGEVYKISDDGKRLQPMVLQSELPLYLDETSEQVKALRKKLEDILHKSDAKFRSYRGIRVLLLDMAHNGLDIGYHAGFSKEGPGIVQRWLQQLVQPSSRIDYVCISQGMRLWTGKDMRRIMTGHKYEDEPHPNYKEAWRRAGLPSILSSFTATTPRHT
jgi:hypothetical protein